MMPFMKPGGGRLKSYDILKWAVGTDEMPRGPFILRGVVDEFRGQLSQKTDKGGQSLAQKDASERLRKLLKSGMIMVVTTSSLQEYAHEYKVQVRKKDLNSGRWVKVLVTVAPLLTPEQSKQYTNEISGLGITEGQGRKPRVYLATKKGIEYVAFREKQPQGPPPVEAQEEEGLEEEV